LNTATGGFAATRTDDESGADHPEIHEFL